MVKKVALITGSSSGIGSEIAVQLAMRGFVSIINYKTNLQGAERTLETIKNAGGEALIIKADVSLEADVKYMFQKIIDLYKRIDVIVNNAGVFKFQYFEDITRDSFDDHFNTNVWGAILVIREAAKYMMRGSCVINISSIRSSNPEPSELLYASSKSALDTVTRVLAKELGARGIRFNTLAPGVVDTKKQGQISIISDYEQKVIDQTPLGRLGNTDDIAKVVCFLVSDSAYWITGERIRVSGGLL